jgi:hypothetical protein
MKLKLIYLIIVLFTSSCSTTISTTENNSYSPPSHKNIPSSISKKKCIDYKHPIEQAKEDNDFDQLEALLAKLYQQPDCPISLVDVVKRSMAQIAAARAYELTQQGKLTEAETWLKRAPTMIWETQRVYGDIASHRKQWHMATHFYHQTLEFIADPKATPKLPKQALINNLYQLLS